jgi:hypothetical protein
VVSLFFYSHQFLIALFSTADNVKGHIKGFDLDPIYILWLETKFLF